MPIAFEGVSYSYADPARQEKRKSRVKRRREAGVIEDPPSLEHGKPAWGADPDAVWALRDITFELDDGEFLGIAGHTGSGKSTLIQHMNGLVHPTRGRVLLDGQDLADKRAAQACRGKVGLVFQYPEYQLFAATVREDVAFGPRNLGLPADEVDRRVEAALESVRLDIAELGDKSPFELSGGQQRRVAFAGVLAMEPRVLVLDEPVAGLDPVAREEFLDLIAQLHAGGLTVVMVSHSMDDLARLSDRVLVLNEGRQFAFGSPAEVFAHGDELRAIGLDVPAPQKLASELREAGVNLPRDLYDVETLANDLAAAFNSQAETDTGKGGSVRSGEAKAAQLLSVARPRLPPPRRLNRLPLGRLRRPRDGAKAAKLLSGVPPTPKSSLPRSNPRCFPLSRSNRSPPRTRPCAARAARTPACSR